MSVCHEELSCKIEVKWLGDELSCKKYMTTDTYMTNESTSKVHGHWPVKYPVGNIKDRERSVYRLSPQWYMLTPLLFCKLGGFLLYLYWPLTVTLLRVYISSYCGVTYFREVLKIVSFASTLSFAIFCTSQFPLLLESFWTFWAFWAFQNSCIFFLRGRMISCTLSLADLQYSLRYPRYPSTYTFILLKYS